MTSQTLAIFLIRATFVSTALAIGVASTMMLSRLLGTPPLAFRLSFGSATMAMKSGRLDVMT